MVKPRICAVITNSDIEAIKSVEPLVDLFELRMDLVGGGWQQVAEQLEKPWIACNRSMGQGGKAGEDRLERLLEAAELGADIVDVEYGSGDIAIVHQIKKKAQCLMSFHDLTGTPDIEKLRGLVEGQQDAGADICKVVTTARSLADNWTVMQLVSESCGNIKIVSFAMGDCGTLSRVLCPLAGGYFTYASIAEGRESAPGQLTVSQLAGMYRMVKHE